MKEIGWLLEKDKRDHIVYSFAICMAICTILVSIDYAVLIGLFVTIGIGGLKEFYDFYAPNRTSDYKDFIADVIGAVIASFMFQMFILL